jgi:hypothetical protein
MGSVAWSGVGVIVQVKGDELTRLSAVPSLSWGPECAVIGYSK